MKKIILTALLLAFFSTSAMAAVISAKTTIGSLEFSPSNRVYVAGASAATSYFFESLHASGSRVFSTDEAASVIYWRDRTMTLGTETPPVPTSANWTSSAAADTVASGSKL